MTDEIDPAEAEQARALLADWWNARIGPSEPRMVADSFAGWQVGRWEEFLLYAPAGGHANQQYLVGHGVVKPFSFATDTIDSALKAARDERDGLIVPDPPRPSPF
jgi:hypothetical protein